MNHVVKSAIQVVCTKVSAKMHLGGVVDVSEWVSRGIIIKGQQSQIDLSGIIDYDSKLRVPERPIK